MSGYKTLYFLIILVISITAGGCVSMEQTIYLGNTEAYSPVAVPPVHVDTSPETGKLNVSPRFYISSQKNVEGKTENHYYPGQIPSDTMKYTVKENNLNWNIPEVNLGVDLDFEVTKSFGLFGGINYSNSDQKDFWGGNFGLGIFNKGENSVIRFDAGFVYQQHFYNAQTIVYTKEMFGSKKEYFVLFIDQGDRFNLNPFFTFTVNSINKETPFNYFFSLGYFTQNLLDFEPGRRADGAPFTYRPDVLTTDLRAECKAAFLLLTPGISYRLDKQVNLNFNLKIMKEFNIKSASQSWFAFPSFQMDWEM